MIIYAGSHSTLASHPAALASGCWIINYILTLRACIERWTLYPSMNAQDLCDWPYSVLKVLEKQISLCSTWVNTLRKR